MIQMTRLILVLTVIFGCFGCWRDPSGAKPQADSQDAKKTTPVSEAKEQSEVTIDLSVDVPPETPKDATVYLAGSLPQLGATWKADGLALLRDSSSPNRWRTTLTLPKGVVLEYKLTLGAWERVERDAAGQNVVNRKLRLDGDQQVQIAVGSWANEVPVCRGKRRSAATSDSTRTSGRPTSATAATSPFIFRPVTRNRAIVTRCSTCTTARTSFDDATSYAGEWRPMRRPSG